MSARTRTAGQAIQRWWIVPAVLISLTAGLGSLVATPQAALATARGASSISAGGNQSCAIQSGKAYCWGGNQDGQLGNGTTTNSGVPVAVDTSGVLPGQILAQISAGDDSNTCALSRTGKAYCWGDNEFGGLGDASTAGSGVPVAVDTSGVLAGKTLTQITTGGVTCALDSTGAAYCWGGNAPAALGDASTAPPASRWPWTPAACWLARRSPRSPTATGTPASSTAPAPRTAGAATSSANWAMQTPPTPASQ
jgi:alpha-tubulin suppressor-like RCC1 family protein